MTYAIQLTYNSENYFSYRNYKGEWTVCMTVPEATTFKTEKGAWRAIQNSDKFIYAGRGSSCWQDLLQKQGYEVNVVNIDQKCDDMPILEVAEQPAEPVAEVETNLQEISQSEVAEQPAVPTIADYQLQLDDLRQQEDELFKQALTNPQEAHLAQFEAIWNKRNEVYMQMENAITIISKPVQETETQEQGTYSVEELKAIPRMNMHCSELAGKLFYSLDDRAQLIKGFKLPATIIGQYELTLRQVAILEGKLKIAPQVEDVPSRHDNYSELVRDTEGYVCTAREIIMGRD